MDVCANAEVANSDKAAVGSISGSPGEVIYVTCDDGYSGSGNATCESDAQFSLPMCDGTQSTDSIFLITLIDLLLSCCVQPLLRIVPLWPRQQRVARPGVQPLRWTLLAGTLVWMVTLPTRASRAKSTMPLLVPGQQRQHVQVFQLAWCDIASKQTT